MSYRYEVEVKIISAKNVKNVNWRNGPTRPYAVVWIDPNQKYSTRSDDTNDTEPVWNETLRLPLSSPIDDQTTVFIDIVHAGAEPDTKRLIGSARLLLREILDDNNDSERSLSLKRPSGRPQGKLEVRVSVRDPYRPMPYGVGPNYSGNAYYAPPPPPPPVPGYPYSPYGSTGYEGGEEKKGKFGGMGTGLAIGAVGGLVGGIALAEGADYLEDEIAGDAADKVEDHLASDDDADDF